MTAVPTQITTSASAPTLPAACGPISEAVVRALATGRVDGLPVTCPERTVVDVWSRTDRAPNAHVGVEVDADGFLELLVERIGSLG